MNPFSVRRVVDIHGMSARKRTAIAQERYDRAAANMDDEFDRRGITDPEARAAAHMRLLELYRCHGVKTARERAEEELDEFLKGGA